MEDAIALSVLDQLPFMRTYTQMLLCFPLGPQADRSAITGVLRRAGTALTKAIPILAGQAVNRKDDSSDVRSSGVFQVIPYNDPTGSPVQSKVLDTFVSYEELRAAKAPASMLDARLLAPQKGLPEHYGDSDVTPVWMVQANYIPGGLLLCFSGMHNTMDATGLGQTIRMFATLCRGESLSPEDLQVANFDRSRLPVALKPNQAPMAHPEVAAKANPPKLDPPTSLPASVWSYVNIPNAKLKELKAQSSKDLGSDIPWVSTNDAVTAWFWKFISQTRSIRVGQDKSTELLRAISGRLIFDPPLPKSYIGNVVTCAFNRSSLRSLVDQPLSETAQDVRRATLGINDHYMRSFAAFIGAEPDKSQITFPMDDPDLDLIFSSWAALPVYEDFGSIVGYPEYVRRPTSPPWNGVCYMMPKRPDNSLDLLVCLREDDMLNLRKDEQFAAVADYIG
ncbi:MAG: hypothetical protein L6R41_007280 [Letrouitia leprolyta]|nr:MAG: hypothetical protein L6R41_007280 [Letrouitia leprolyta]